ncbi:MAG: hypothetical protein NTX25_06005 [Proteobacteria bacterium]|nr:hypothetical protein [Pseudomonadota bacterium]
MHNLVWLLLLLLFTACHEKNEAPLGQVQDCDNGTYFSLSEQNCLKLWGHETLVDADGYERLQIFNGITVPSKINGQSPFKVDVAYNFSTKSNLEVTMKHVDFGEIGGESFTDTQKVSIEAGQGTTSVTLHPNQTIAPGPGASQIDGKWSRDSGYVIEVKGGDRFEDEDSDNFRAWRVAGIQVAKDRKDDPSAKQMVLGELSGPIEIQACELVTVTLAIDKLEFPASFGLGLKRPGNGWDSWGEQYIEKEAGFQGLISFQFTAKKDKTCAPAGPAAVSDADGNYAKDAYLLQLDVWDSKHNKLDKSSRDYTVKTQSMPVTVINNSLVKSQAEAQTF